MIQNYISNHLNKIKYETLDNGGIFYAEIKNLRWVWATGKTKKECKQNLADTIEGWIILRLQKNLPIPDLKIPSYKISLKKYA